MIVQCPQCHARFRVADEKVTDRGVKMRCTKCASVFRITRADAQDGPAPAGATPAPASPEPTGSPAPGKRVVPNLPTPRSFTYGAAAPDPPPLPAVPAVPAVPAPLAGAPTYPSAVPPPAPPPPPSAMDLDAALDAALSSVSPFPSASPPGPPPPVYRATPPPPPPSADIDPFAELSVPPPSAVGAPRPSPPRGTPAPAEMFPPAPPTQTPVLEAALAPGTGPTPSFAPPTAAPPTDDPFADLDMGAAAAPPPAAFPAAGPAPEPPAAAEAPAPPAGELDFGGLLDEAPAGAAPAQPAADASAPGSDASGFDEPAPAAPEAPEAPAVPAAALPPASLGRSLAAALFNVGSALVIGLAALFAIAAVRTPRPLTVSDLGFPMVWLALGFDDGGDGPPFVVERLRTGFYPTADGRDLFYVRGDIANIGGAGADALHAAVELVRDGRIVSRAESLAGLDAGPEELQALVSRKNEDLQQRLARGRAVPRVAARGKAPFVAVFPLAVADSGDSSVRVTVIEGIPPAMRDSPGRGDAAPSAPAAPAAAAPAAPEAASGAGAP